MPSTTTQEVKTTTYSMASRGGNEMSSRGLQRESNLSLGNAFYESSGFYGPGSRPERLTYDKRSLSGSSLSAAISIRDSREKEKREIVDLNDRFAAYIEKVRFLDAQNRKMTNDLELFRARMGKDTLSTKAMFEGEITEAKKLISVTQSERVELEKQIAGLLAEISDYRTKYDKALEAHNLDRTKIDNLIVSFTDIEREINLLKRRIAELENETGDLKKINVTDSNTLSRARTEIDQESLSRVDFRNKVSMLLEEIEFTSRENELELSDLHATAARDTTTENREYFKNELASAIRAIRAEYDQVVGTYRADIESRYHREVQQVYTSSTRKTLEFGYKKEEVKRLRNQLGDLRARLADFESRNSLLEKQIGDLNFQMEEEQRQYTYTLNERDGESRKIREQCEALMLEMQNLLEAKQTLESEIVQYRLLLEGEESRSGLRKVESGNGQFVSVGGGSVSGGGASMHGGGNSYSSVVTGGTASQMVSGGAASYSSSVTSAITESERRTQEVGETTSKIHFQGSAKGNISIQDASVDGKFVVIENTSMTKEEDLAGWTLKRNVDNGEDIVFHFPTPFLLKPRATVKVWASGQGGTNNPPDEIIFEDKDSFGAGMNAKTVLVDAKGEERASHIQTTTQSTLISA